LLKHILNWSGCSVARLYGALLLNMDVYFQAPLPNGAKIIASNHPSTTDAFLMMGLTGKPVYILINDFVFKMPALGLFLRGAGHIPVVIGSGRPAFNTAVELLKDGKTVGIYPEGLLSPLDGGHRPPHTGVARLALASGAPVIPAGVGLDPKRIWFRQARAGGMSDEARWYLRGRYAVTVGHPMRFGCDGEDRAYVYSATQAVMQQVMHLAGQSTSRAFGTRAKNRALKLALPRF
jgi:1-acyl-sn-glycerol-3-phosphate acyltransferase